MPNWSDRREINIQNLLTSFSTGDLLRLLQGKLSLVCYVDPETGKENFCACDLSGKTRPRYWALTTASGANYFADEAIRSETKLSRLTLGQTQLLDLVRGAASSKQRNNLFLALFSTDYFHGRKQKRFYDSARQELLESLISTPKLLIDAVHYRLQQGESAVNDVVELLCEMRKYCSTPERYRQLLNAQHEAKSVIDVLLEHESLADNLSRENYASLLNLLYADARRVATPALVDAAVRRFATQRAMLGEILFSAAACADNAMIKRLLADDATQRLVSVGVAEPFYDETVLHRALAAGADDASIRQLVAQTKDLNHKNRYGETPLMLAAKHGRANVIAMLLRYHSVGQALHLQDNRGNTALHLAAKHAGAAELRLLLAHPAMRVDLVNRLNRNHDSALALAGSEHRTDAVRLLLVHGANVYTSNRQGQSPADLAGGHEATLVLLHPGAGDYMAQAEPRSVATVVGTAVTLAEAVSPRVLEHRERVTRLLQKQMNDDKHYTRDAPLVRKHIDRACEAIEQAKDLPAIHRVLRLLYQRQAVWPEGRGKETPRSYLRSTTVVHLRHMGYLPDSRLTGKAWVPGLPIDEKVCYFARNFGEKRFLQCSR